jgi:hypothetical protein
MEATIGQQLNDLLMRRERIKLDLMEKQAQQAQDHYRYIAFGESVSLEDRLALQAQIASLDADRQSTKVHLLAMKQKAKEVRAFGFRSAIEQKLAAINMQHLVEEALAEAHAEMLRQGFGDAYKQNL